MEENEGRVEVTTSSADYIKIPFNAVSFEFEKMKPWLKFIGIVFIIYGAIYAITIVGIVFAWLPIWLGVILMNASKDANSFLNMRDGKYIIPFLMNIRKFYVIVGIIMIISFAMMALAMIIYAAMAATILAGFSEILGNF